MAQSSLALTLGNISVRQLDGLFSLNDLHKAAGGAKRHQPSDFLRIEQTQALIAEIDSTDSQSASSADSRSLAFKTVVGKGKAQGTYACRELVIAYAAWISATFHLKVIRVFLNAVQPVPEQLALDYTRISPAQAQHLKELVQLVAGSGKQTFGETWNRLHRKMKVNSYLELPASRFDEACNYLRGKMDDTSMATLIQKHFPARAPAHHQMQTMDTIHAQPLPQPGSDHIASTFMASQSIAAQVQKSVFNAVLCGGDDWKFQRWEVSFITDSREAIPAMVQKLGADEFTTSMRRLTREIEKSGGAKFSNAELAGLIGACCKSLAERAGNQAETRMVAA